MNNESRLVTGLDSHASTYKDGFKQLSKNEDPKLTCFSPWKD